LAMIAMVTLPGYVVVYQFFVRRIRLTNRMIREANASVYGTIGDGVNGVRVMKAFARELRELRRFFSGVADFFRLQMRNSVLNTSLSVLCGLISGVGTTAVVYLGILSIRDGQMTLGEFLYFHGSVGFLFGPVVSLSNMNIMVQWVMTALHRIFEIMDEDITIEDAPNAVRLDELHGEVTFNNVSLKYDPDKDRQALHRVNFGVLPGQMVCVVGASGAGKTSLVNLLLRMYSPSGGRITIDGEDIQDLALSSLRKHIRMVPQEPMLFSGTLAENIRYGNPQASPNEVVAASKAAELHDFVMDLPAKYETRIGEGGVSLSGGQKQRMALAMTLLTNPSVLILDDSTSALDAKTEARIYRTLDRIMETRTAFVITHKLAMARKADLILVLEKGHLVEWGTHDRLVVQRGMYYDLFETQLTDREKQVNSVTDETSVTV
jgi:ABC-type multidrug transport system fused ATPase/permease subunit